MSKNRVMIIGGGPAGLTAAIDFAGKGIETTVFEKNLYPHHKVCGEYLSKEILPYYRELDIPLEELGPKEITRIKYSTLNGCSVSAELPLGGLGLSRYGLDDLLFRTAEKKGINVIHEKINGVRFVNDQFEITTDDNVYLSKYVLGAYGKRDILDKHLERNFFKKPAPWVAVKSHYEKNDFPSDLVELHNFKGGYCGLSKTETGAVNVCFLATYKGFREFKDPILFKDRVLRKNPFLNKFFSEANEIFEKPLCIGQVSFEPKPPVEDHILMIGDTAGLIHPLCGNGMAMAITSARLAVGVMMKHIQENKPDRGAIEMEYTHLWKKEFTGRIRTGRYLQKVLLSESLADIVASVVSTFPFLLPKIIRQTHGKLRQC